MLFIVFDDLVSSLPKSFKQHYTLFDKIEVFSTTLALVNFLVFFQIVHKINPYGNIFR